MKMVIFFNKKTNKKMHVSLTSELYVRDLHGGVELCSLAIQFEGTTAP